MAKKWSEIESNQSFQILAPEQKHAIKQEYFNTFVAPSFSKDELDLARNEFLGEQPKPQQQKSQDLSPYVDGLRQMAMSGMTAPQTPKIINQPIPIFGGKTAGQQINASMGLKDAPNVTNGFGDALAMFPGAVADVAQNISNPTYSKSFLGNSVASIADQATVPSNYMIPGAMEAGSLALGKLLGKTTLGRVAQLPLNRVQDMLKGKISPEVADRLIRKIKFIKTHGKHVPTKMTDEEIAPPEPVKPVDDSRFMPKEQESIPIQNEVIDQPNIIINAPEELAKPIPEVVGSGAEKTRGASERIAGKTGYEGDDLPSYNVLTDIQQLKIIAQVVAENPELAKMIAMGQAEAPRGSTASAFLSFLENKAIREGDTALAEELAKYSSVIKQGTEAGQFASSFRNMNPDSPARAVNDIRTAREASLKRQGKDNSKEVESLRQKLEEAQGKLQEYETKKLAKMNPTSKDFGLQNKVFTKENFEQAKASFKQKMSGFHSGVDPTALKEIVDIGGFYFEGGLRNFNLWSKKMIDEFGEKIKPYLSAAWKHINKAFEADERKTIIGKISKNVENNSEVGYQVNELAKNLISSGITDREKLIGEIFKVLKEIMPSITRRETMDAISGYGKYKLLSKEEIAVKLHDLKGQMQQVAKLEDLKAQKPPLKTGGERRTPSDEERRLLALVGEAKKKYNVETTNPENQLKSSLDTIKTRLLNQIKDLKSQIESKEKLVKEKYAVKDTPEIAALRAERNKLKEQFHKIFGNPKMSDEKRLETSIKAVTRSIVEYRKKIKSGGVAKGTTKTSVNSPELERLKALRDSLRSQYQKNNSQEIKLNALKKRLTTKISELENRLNNKNFANGASPAVKLDAEAMKLQAKADQAKMAYQAASKVKDTVTATEVSEIVRLSKNISDKKALIDRKSPNSSPSRMEYGMAKAQFDRYVGGLKLKAKEMTWADFKAHPFRSSASKFADVSGFNKYMVAMGDMSATLLQGGKMLVIRPRQWALNTAEQFVDFAKTVGGKDAELLVMADLYSRENALNGVYAKHGLEGMVLEESFPVPFVEKIPGLGRVFKGFENSFTGFVRRGRADMFDHWYAKLKAKGADTEGLGILANSFMGRGLLPFGLEKNAPVFNKVFFAPKNFMADVDYLLAHQNTKDMSGAVKSIAFMNLLTSTVATAIVLGTAYAINPKAVEFDPRSSDLGTIRRGNTSYSLPFLGRVLPIITLLTRMKMWEAKSTVTGKITKLNSGDYGSKTVGNVVAEFFTNRLAPMASVLNDREMRNENFLGEKPTVAGDIKNLTVPFPIKTFIELMKDPDVANQIMGNLYSFFGGRISSYPRVNKFKSRGRRRA